MKKPKKLIHFSFKIGILKFSFACLGLKKVSIRPSIEWGWDS